MLSFDKAAKCFLRSGQPIKLSAEDQAAISRMCWRQVIPFAPGVESPGYLRCADLLEKYLFHTLKLDGLSVLGVGCNEGFPLYMAEALGASRVVGLTDDLGLYPPVNEARTFAKRVLESKVEFLDYRIEDLSVSDIGQFDVVMCFDVISNVIDPFDLLRRLTRIANKAIILATPFVIASAQESFQMLFLDHGVGDYSANRTAVTHTWIDRAVSSLGWTKGTSTVWEKDYLVACLVRGEPSPHLEPVSLRELPTDHGMEHRTAVLMMSCSRYRQVWRPFFELFYRYWPDCPYRVYLGTDQGVYPGVETIELGEDRHWASNVLAVTERIVADQILLFQEDFLLDAPVDTEALRRLVRHALDYSIGSMRFVSFPAPTLRWKGTDFVGQLGRFDDFRFSFQLSLWNKDFYRSLMGPGDDPWTTEFVAARRAVTSDLPFVAVQPWNKPPITYFPYAIDKGEWRDETLEFLRREGISLDGITKRLR